MENFNTSSINKKGLLVCKQCGVGFNNLPSHILKRHGYSASEYKKRYNLNPKEVLFSPSLRKKRRKIALKNSDTNWKNLVELGQNTRFKIGNTFTPVEKLKVINSVAQKKRWTKIKRVELLEFKKRINRYEDKQVLDALEEIKKPLDNDALITKVFNHLKERNVLKTSDADLMVIAKRTVEQD